MWLSEKNGKEQPGPALWGTVSIGGVETAVCAEAEYRGVRAICPGGFVWIPAQGRQVLALRDGAGQPVMLGVLCPPEKDMLPGEVRLYTGGASITLKNDGRILLAGRVAVEGGLTVNGTEIG